MPTSEKIRKLVEIYAELSVEERREFEDIVALGNPDAGEVGEEWRAEIRLRAEDIDAGRIEMVDGEEFLQRLRAICWRRASFSSPRRRRPSPWRA